jgi:hypothetical protein
VDAAERMGGLIVTLVPFYWERSLGASWRVLEGHVLGGLSGLAE